MKKNKGHILITRSLAEESPLWQLSRDGYHIIDRSFLELTSLPIIEIPKADVYFYYSKNGAQHFVKAARSLNLDLGKSKHAAMGKGTAAILTNLGIEVDFIGDGAPTEIAQTLIATYSNVSICFVRAEQSTQSIQNKWPYPYREVIAYSIKENVTDIKEDVHTIIATSPKNLKCAVNSCQTLNLKRIICIGPTTYAAAQKYDDLILMMAKQSTESALLDAFYKEKFD